MPVFTIGHSTRTIQEFVAILRSGGVRLVIDVRTVPRSRTNPQYNADALPKELDPCQLAYDRIAGLGGLRGRSRTVAPDVNGFWVNQSFHNYADYALSPAFGEALDMLIGRASAERTAIMCSEAVWWRCHRRIIADYLLLRGLTVIHLMGEARADPARLTSGAKQNDGRLFYPAAEASAD